MCIRLGPGPTLNARNSCHALLHHHFGLGLRLLDPVLGHRPVRHPLLGHRHRLILRHNYHCFHLHSSTDQSSLDSRHHPRHRLHSPGNLNPVNLIVGSLHIHIGDRFRSGLSHRHHLSRRPDPDSHLHRHDRLHSSHHSLLRYCLRYHSHLPNPVLGC